MAFEIDQSSFRQFGSLEIIAKQVVEGFITGLHKSPFHGFSVEFAEHRQYNTGESVKNIDWKLFGRTDRLYTKRFEEETNLRCQIILDNSSSMYYPVLEKPSLEHPNKITFSIYVAAALINLLRKQRDAAGISIFSDTIELHTQAKSSSVHNKYLYTELERLLHPISPDVRKKTAAVDALHQVAERIHKRSLVIVLSDMFENIANNEDLFSALQHLRHNRHEVVLFHVVDKGKELDFDFDNRPYRFIDLESGEELKAFPAKVREQYLATIEKYRSELKLRCGQYHIDFVEADINAGFQQVLLPYLVKRERMM
ncbi:MAG: DUF58 domain-containing protein [Bacteroidetes bacterium]|nr:DUF58 domain-containing protein [Bacteroidota bacterium]